MNPKQDIALLTHWGRVFISNQKWYSQDRNLRDRDFRICAFCWEAMPLQGLIFICTGGAQPFSLLPATLRLLFLNYSRQWVKDVFSFLHCFCFASTHWAKLASTRLFDRLSTKYHHTVDRVFINARPMCLVPDASSDCKSCFLPPALCTRLEENAPAV